METLHLNDEILIQMLESAWCEQNTEPFSNDTLTMQSALEKALKKFADKDEDDDRRYDIENDLVCLLSCANLDGFEDGARAALRMFRAFNRK